MSLESLGLPEHFAALATLELGQLVNIFVASSTSANSSALTPASSAAATSTAAALADHVLLDHVNDLIGDPEVLYGAAPEHWHPPEIVPVRTGARFKSQRSYFYFMCEYLNDIDRGAPPAWGGSVRS